MLSDKTRLSLASARSLLGWQTVDKLARRAWSYCFLSTVSLSFILSYFERSLVGWAGIAVWSGEHLVIVFTTFAALFAGAFVGCDIIMRRLLRRELERCGYVLLAGMEWVPTSRSQAEGRLSRSGVKS